MTPKDAGSVRAAAYSDRDPRLLETSGMGSLPDNKEGRGEGHEVGPGRSRGSSDERPGSDGNPGLRPGPTASVPGAKPGEVVGAGELPGMGRHQPIGGKVTQHYWFLLALIWAAFVVGRLK